MHMNTHTQTHTMLADQVEHLHFKGTGREIQVPPEGLLFYLRSIF